jgi:hypothetical protein
MNRETRERTFAHASHWQRCARVEAQVVGSDYRLVVESSHASINAMRRAGSERLCADVGVLSKREVCAASAVRAAAKWTGAKTMF